MLEVAAVVELLGVFAEAVDPSETVGLQAPVLAESVLLAQSETCEPCLEAQMVAVAA